jgi:hypothetical protein
MAIDLQNCCARSFPIDEQFFIGQALCGQGSRQ